MRKQEGYKGGNNNMALSALEKAYKKAEDAFKLTTDAEKANIQANRQKTEKEVGEGLRSAYAQSIRSKALNPQKNRVAGITGGIAENRALAADTAYDAGRSQLLNSRELQRQTYDIEEKKIDAAYKQNVAQSQLNLEQQKFNIKQNEEQRKADVYKTMLSVGYADENAAKILGVPIAALNKYVKYVKESKS